MELAIILQEYHVPQPMRSGCSAKRVHLTPVYLAADHLWRKKNLRCRIRDRRLFSSVLDAIFHKVRLQLCTWMIFGSSDLELSKRVLLDGLVKTQKKEDLTVVLQGEAHIHTTLGGLVWILKTGGWHFQASLYIFSLCRIFFIFDSGELCIIEEPQSLLSR